METKKILKKCLSVLLCFNMIFCLSFTVFADNNLENIEINENAETIEIEENVEDMTIQTSLSESEVNKSRESNHFG